MWQGSLKDKPGGVPFPVPTGKLNTRKSAMSETGWRKPVSDIAFDPEKSKRTMRYAAKERALNSFFRPNHFHWAACRRLPHAVFRRFRRPVNLGASVLGNPKNLRANFRAKATADAALPVNPNLHFSHTSSGYLILPATDIFYS
jgi:hypothetical protein